MNNYEEIILQLSKLVIKSYDKIKNDKKKNFSIEKNLKRDVKIGADRRLEKLIIEYLLDNSTFNILSEESGYIKNKNKNSKYKNYRWIIDPLDGSFNFLHDIPINCISIALWERDKPVLGIIYDFNRNELFNGIVGKGAWLNGESIKTSMSDKINQSVLCTGFPADSNFSNDTLNNFCRNIRNFKKIRLLGSAALSLAYVACGRADIYMEDGIKIWDVAAGLAIVSAAGGHIEYESMKKKNCMKVIASNALLKL